MNNIPSFKSSVLTDIESTRLLRSAFPRSLEAYVDNALRVVPLADTRPFVNEHASVDVRGEEFRLLRRVYFDYVYLKDGSWHTHARWQMPSLEQDVLACIYSTHHDGVVRAQSINRLIESRHDWALPYLLNLVSDYVVEITELIDYRADRIDIEIAHQFAASNHRYVSRIADRVLSYWSLWHRVRHHSGTDHPQYAWLEDYPAYKTLKRLDIWPRTLARNSLRKQRKLRAKRIARGLEK
jgi:hypothetical protein